MKKLLFFVLVFSFHVAAQAADEFSTLEERMSGKEFKETGLGKLTDAELAALNDWLRRHSVATLENAAAHPADSAATGAVWQPVQRKICGALRTSQKEARKMMSFIALSLEPLTDGKQRDAV